jgi:hypothetical protein
MSTVNKSVLTAHCILCDIIIDDWVTDEDWADKPPLPSAAGPSIDDKENVNAQSVDVKVAIDRMGPLVLAIKALFDSKSSESGMVARKDITSLLMDLGLRGAAVANAAVAVDTLLALGDSSLLDFPAFLQLYASQCGLGSPQSPQGRVMTWAPTHTGIWKEVHNMCSIVEAFCIFLSN